MYGRRGRLVEARVGSVLGGYAFGLPLVGDDDCDPDWFIDTVAVAPALYASNRHTKCRDVSEVEHALFSLGKNPAK